MRNSYRLIALLVFVASVVCACSAQLPLDRFKSLGYVPASAATQALDAAKKEASASNKRILIVAGGDWCRWCYVLDRFLRDTPDIGAQWREAFVVVKYEAGENGEGNRVLDALRPTNAYPHFWVLAADGSFIASVRTDAMELGDNDYDAHAFREFLNIYGPHANTRP